jgi:hypothetical protein
MTVKEKNELYNRAASGLDVGGSLVYLGLFVTIVCSAVLLSLEVD